MADKVLLLWLEGPLQSWGDRSKFDVRETLPFPTWSALCGMMCAALGRGGEQRELLARMTAAAPRFYAFSGAEGEPVLLRDFQTVGLGYREDDPFELLAVPKKADGTKAVGSGVIILHKYALQQAYFAAALPLEELLAQEIYQALLRPERPIYLGRKAYAPSDLVARGLYADFAESEAAAAQIAASKGLHQTFKVLPYPEFTQGDLQEVFDVPIYFGAHKKCSARYVTIIKEEG